MSIFPTALGWMGLVGREQVVTWLSIGHEDSTKVRRWLKDAAVNAVESDWHPELRDRLERYAAGEPIDFADVRIDLPECSRFRQRVLQVARKLSYGETATYGELAARAGKPGAARAVGTAMSTNRFPLIVPCHRVVAAGGGLGGYSAPQGPELKRRLLDMEQQTK